MGSKKSLNGALRSLLEQQHYEFSGSHAAVKICEWTKKSLKDEGVCYKERFYGIKSHLCCQMTPAVNFCSHSCVFCWRPIEYNLGVKFKAKDNPKDIVDNCIKAQRKKLNGFWGNKKINKRKLKEAQDPKHMAISLSGEPTFYPRLPELIDEIKSRNSTAFLVSNGTNPGMIKKLLNHEPTQLYITLPAPNEDIYKKVCNPLISGGWKKIMQSISLLKDFKYNTVLRMTLVKGYNMVYPAQYAEIIKSSGVKFVEIKSYMWVGYSRQRLTIDNMPLHEEIREFAKKIANLSDYKIKDEKTESRVVLLEKT